jgi:hypothetical protein
MRHVVRRIVRPSRPMRTGTCSAEQHAPGTTPSNPEEKVQARGQRCRRHR